MNPLQIAGICFGAFLIPLVVVLSINSDGIVKEDRKLGTLLYFKGG
jgi:hypothetical protein